MSPVSPKQYLPFLWGDAGKVGGRLRRPPGLERLLAKVSNLASPASPASPTLLPSCKSRGFGVPLVLASLLPLSSASLVLPKWPRRCPPPARCSHALSCGRHRATTPAIAAP